MRAHASELRSLVLRIMNCNYVRGVCKVAPNSLGTYCSTGRFDKDGEQFRSSTTFRVTHEQFPRNLIGFHAKCGGCFKIISLLINFSTTFGLFFFSWTLSILIYFIKKHILTKLLKSERKKRIYNFLNIYFIFNK